MKRKIWLPKDLIGSRSPTDSEHRAIYSFMQKEYRQKGKKTYTISLILAAVGSTLLIIGMLANKNVPLLLISTLLLALGLVEAMTAHAYYIREQAFRDGKYQVVDGHIYNTTKSEKTGGILAGFLSDFGDLLRCEQKNRSLVLQRKFRRSYGRVFGRRNLEIRYILLIYERISHITIGKS